jgi:hypothetical protein
MQVSLKSYCFLCVTCTAMEIGPNISTFALHALFAMCVYHSCRCFVSSQAAVLAILI